MNATTTDLRMSNSLSRWLIATAAAATIAVLGAVAAGPAGAAADSCPNAAFRTGPSADLPDCRADELVSPAGGKNGADILADAGRTRAAADGSAVTFSSLTGFGDVMGTSVASDYMSVRSKVAAPGTSGWTTHATTPFQEPNTLSSLNVEPLFVGEFSPDLGTGVFQSSTSLTDDANVTNVPNLYLRRDMRASGHGAYQLLTPCPACDVTGSAFPPLTFQWQPIPAYAGATNDFHTVLLESVLNLTGDAPAQTNPDCATSAFLCSPRAYAWRGGEFALAGLVPSGSDITCGGSAAACVAAGASIWGQGPGSIGGAPKYRGNVVSDDGSRMFFTVPTDGQGSGRIYVRTAGATTDEITASERTDCAGDQTCGGDGVADPAPDSFQPAKFWGASADGSRVFFTSGQALTDDAPVGGDRLLYMYDANKPASDPHNLTWLNVDRETAALSNDVQTVLAVSDNGRYVYFMGSGQLVAGGPPIESGQAIFMWHDGEIAFIGTVALNEVTENSLTGSSGPQTRITPDGRHLVFTTHDARVGFLGYDHGSCPSENNSGCREIYLYSADSHGLVCVSCNPSGARATADADVRVKVNEGGQKSTWHINRAITDDGSRVFFSTGEALVAKDTNGKSDVYQYDVASKTLHLITSGVSGGNSYFLDASRDGSDVFYVTRERRVGWDTDTSVDLYDARVDGGFPGPPPAPASCREDDCQGPSSAGPQGRGPGSDGLEGVGDVAGGSRSSIGSVGKLSLAARSALARGAKARLRVTVNRAGKVTLAGTAKVGGRTRRVASSSATARGAGSVSVPFGLSQSARVQLRQRGSLRLSLVLRFNGVSPKVVSIALKAPRAAKSQKGGRS